MLIKLFEGALEKADQLPAGATWDAVKKLLPAQARDQIEQLWEPMLRPLSDLAADKTVLTIPLFDGSQTQAATAFGWDWKFKGNHRGLVTADVLDAEELEAHKITGIQGHHVVRYVAQGALGASVTGGHDVGAWKLSTGVTADAGATFEWFLSDESTRTLAAAAARSRNGFTAPMSLPDMFKVTNQATFWGCKATINGQLKASFAAGANTSGTGWSWGADGKREEIGFTAGMEGKVSIKLDGLYELSVMPERDAANQWSLKVKLTRAVGQEKSLALKLSAAVDFSAIPMSAERVARAHLPDPAMLDARLAARLAALMNPGTHLRDLVADKIRAALPDPSLQQLALVAVGGTTPAEASEAFAQRLLAPLMEILDQGADRIANGLPIANATSQLIQRLSLKLDVPPAAVTALEAMVQQCIASVTGKVAASVTGLVADIQVEMNKGAQAQFGKLLEPLGRLGEEVGNALQGVQNTAAAVEGAIKQAITEYARKREALLNTLGDAQRYKASAMFGLAVTESEGKKEVFSARFRVAAGGPTAEAERLYAALWSGTLENFGELAERALATGSVTDISGLLWRTYKRTKTATITITVFGLRFDEKFTSAVDLALEADKATGNIMAVAGGASARQEIANRWTTRQSHLGVAVQVLDPGKPTMRTALELSGAFAGSGKVLKPDYVRELQQAVASICGDDANAVDLAHVLGVPQSTLADKSFWSGAKFVMPVGLSDTEWSEFCRKSNDEIFLMTARIGRRVLDYAYRNHVHFVETSPSRELADHAAAAGIAGVDEALVAGKYLQLFDRDLREAYLREPSNELLHRLGFGAKFPSAGSFPARTMILMFNRLAHLAHALVTLKDSSIAVRAAIDQAQGLGEEAVYRRCKVHLQAMATALEPAAVGSTTFTGLGESVGWPLVTFAGTISALAGRRVPPGIVPMLSVASEPMPIPLV